MDNSFYYRFNRMRRLKLWFCRDHWIYINKYIKYLRKEEKYFMGNNLFFKLLEIFYARKKNRLGLKLGYYISPNSLGNNITIWHHGNIIINGNAKLGDGCILHGNNCIGNNGKDFGVPTIGNNVEIGYGAIVIGNIKIASNVKIAAGAVVVKSCDTEGVTLAGVPAKVIN
ncbi:poly-gamma-glutamate biosynthesis protein [Streptococcus infantarius]|uniref:poly-gamma-glutamate biosynthesis protein n=4 Tax=Streptococcus infantarius TaxID=102684 RepID=UPI0022E6CFD5|nr:MULTISPECIES: poly-gamma-glutamate biosynthesis protein [Streptococcus]